MNNKVKASKSRSNSSRRDITIASKKIYKFAIPKTRHELAKEVLKRWWYCLPDWPKKDYDYTEDLKSKNLREVTWQYWKIEPEMKGGLRKVIQIPGFSGVFKDSEVSKIIIKREIYMI